MAFRVRVRRFRAEEAEFGSVRLGVLLLESEKSVEVTAKTIVDAMLKVVEAISRGAPSPGYYEVVAESGERRLYHGERIGYTWRRRAAFRPVRLYRVGVVRRDILTPALEEAAQGEAGEQAGSGGEGASAGAYSFKLSDVEWHDAPENAYVFETKLTVEDDDVVMVILETEEGRIYLKPASSSRRSRSSRTPSSRDR